MNRAWRAGSNDRKRAPGWAKLFSFGMTARMRGPDSTAGTVGVRSALRAAARRDGK